MIAVRYARDGQRHSLTMTGHAEYAKSGDDIVCAGASAIVYALLGWLQNNSEDLEYVESDVHSGDVRLSCEGGERAATAFEVTTIGLLQLADAYGDHVEINIVGLAD